MKEKSKIVASGIIKKGNTVLALKIKHKSGKSELIPPGGRLETFETLRECVAREIKEEVNLEVKVGELIGVMEKEYEDGIWTFLYYDISVNSGQIKICDSEEVDELVWIKLEEFTDYKLIRWL